MTGQAVLVVILLALGGGLGEKAEVETRQQKLLNVFNIVRFPNDGCNSTISNTYGVCYTASECTALSGTSSGTCASGFGVCCTFTGSCSGSTSVNNTYFASTGSDTSPCTFSVCKASSDICQIRLGFDTFSIAQPSTNQPGDANPNGRTQCQNAQFSANSDGPAPPVICGTNTGYHMILEAKDECNTLTFTWTSGTPSWNIHVMQIPCTATWKPPSGCTQYFTGTTGTVSSYNYQGGVHLASQQYTNCIRAEQGYCTVGYVADTTTAFLMNTISPGTATGSVGDACTDDYVVIPGGGAAAGDATNYDRFCGGLLVVINADSTAQVTVKTNKMPFQIGVVTDGTELDSASATYEWSKGFQLYYSQSSC